MISQNEFITMSLDLNLFFLRIMKEHSFFLEVGFYAERQRYGRESENVQGEIRTTFSEATALANGNVSANLDLQSGNYAIHLEAERLTNLHGIPFNLELTRWRNVAAYRSWSAGCN